MSESPSQEIRPSSREIIRRKAGIFGGILGPLHRDVYLTAINCFPGFTFLRDMSLTINPDSNIISASIVGDNEPNIHIGTARKMVMPRGKSRLMERLQLDPELAEMPDDFFEPFIVAHEMGHIVQHDPLFRYFYGELSQEYPNSKEDYARHVECDQETNADFIMAEIMGNTELGIAAGFMPPVEGPSEWRAWAAQHRLVDTIKMPPDIPPLL
jgi:hypothetical protein